MIISIVKEVQQKCISTFAQQQGNRWNKDGGAA